MFESLEGFYRASAFQTDSRRFVMMLEIRRIMLAVDQVCIIPHACHMTNIWRQRIWYKLQSSTLKFHFIIMKRAFDNELEMTRECLHMWLEIYSD